jgi:hypothetical protein
MQQELGTHVLPGGVSKSQMMKFYLCTDVPVQACAEQTRLQQRESMLTVCLIFPASDDGSAVFRCRGANITLFSPLQRVNQYPTQFFRVDFQGLTAEKNPLYLFNLTGAKQ